MLADRLVLTDRIHRCTGTDRQTVLFVKRNVVKPWDTLDIHNIIRCDQPVAQTDDDIGSAVK